MYRDQFEEIRRAQEQFRAMVEAYKPQLDHATQIAKELAMHRVTVTEQIRERSEMMRAQWGAMTAAIGPYRRGW